MEDRRIGIEINGGDVIEASHIGGQNFQGSGNEKTPKCDVIERCIDHPIWWRMNGLY